MPFDGSGLNPTQRLLIEAADVIRHRGLKKNARGDENGPVCLHGALAFVKNGDTKCDYGTEEATRAVGRYITERLRYPDGVYRYMGFYYCAIWNNEQKRTAKEVIAALEGAVEFA